MILNNLILIGILSLALFIIWAEIMYFFAGKNQPLFFVFVYLLGIGIPLSTLIKNILTTNFITTIIGIVALLIFTIIVAITLYEQAGNKEKRWYYLTLLFPILAIIYQIVKK